MSGPRTASGRRVRTTAPPAVPGITIPTSDDLRAAGLAVNADGELVPLFPAAAAAPALSPTGQPIPTSRGDRRQRRQATFAGGGAVRWVLGYEPTLPHDRAVWPEVEDVVRELALLATTNPAMAQDIDYYLLSILRMAAWHVQTIGPLTSYHQLLDPDTQTRWARDRGRAGDKSIGDRRSRMNVLRQLVHKEPTETLSRRPLSPPYTDDQLKVLETIAKEQPDKHWKRAAELVLVGGLGAGLDMRWLTFVWPDDITDTNDPTRVFVTDPDRYVPVAADWVDRLLALQASTPAGMPMLGRNPTGKNAPNKLISELRHPPEASDEPDADVPRLNAKRLRATWIVGHLTRGTRMKELCAAAGVVNPAAFDSLWQYVPAMDAAAAIREVAGP